MLTNIMLYFIKNPEDILQPLCLALDHYRFHCLREKRVKTQARFYRMQETTPITDVKANKINHFVSIKGVILKTFPVRLLVTRMKFKCFECKREVWLRFKNGEYEAPKQCQLSKGCKSKFFTPDKYSADIILYQRIKLQEIEEDGKINRS